MTVVIVCGMASPHSKRTRQRDSRPAQAEARRRDPRVVAAKAETADARRRLEARIRYEESRRAVTAAEEAVEVDQADLVAQRALRDAVEVFRREARFEELRAVWSLGDARDLVRQGYSVEFTVERTGWPARMLEDVKIDRW